MAGQCPICKYDLAQPGLIPDDTKRLRYHCQNCGDFELSMEAQMNSIPALKEDLHKAALLSHAIRKRHKKGEWVFLFTETIGQILKNTQLPTPAEQADNLILWLGDNSIDPGRTQSISPQTHQAIMGAISLKNVNYIVGSLIEQKLVEGEHQRDRQPSNIFLSFLGWKRYGELKRSISDSRKSFMAMQYGNPELDEIVKKYFRPAVKQTGFDLVLMNDPERQEAGLMDNRMRVEIRTSRFLIADLTDGNQGAYWEAGFAEGLGKPVIYTCSEEIFAKKKTHFDTEHHFTIRWDLNDPSKATEELKATIRASLPAEAKLEDDPGET